MNYSIYKTNIIGTIVLGLALVFVVGLSGISVAHAQYGSSYGSYNNNYGNYNNYENYGHDSYPVPVNYPSSHLPSAPSPVSPLQVSCYPQPLTIQSGDSATWVSNVYGGTGSYSYTWSGTDGLIGSGPTISRVYYNGGTSESATLTVTSGNQVKSVSCSGVVTVYGNNNNYYNPPVIYTPPVVYTPPVTYYSAPQISCIPNVTYSNVGSTVTWSANVYGGTGYNNNNNYYNNNYYTYSPVYSWSGSDGLYGYAQSASITYTTPGYKTAMVTVTVNGQTVTQSCSTSVNVTGYQTTYYTTNTNSNNNSGLDIGCYADPANATINQPITWSVEVTGGATPYTYSWSGTDGLSGSASSIIKYYDTNGQKSAIVSVTSADGKTGTRACTNSLAVGRPAGYNIARTTVNTAPTATQTNNSQSAAALFSLQNIPWGWVAILIILVLFATVLYLIFNRPKI